MAHTDHPDAQWFPDAGLGIFLHWGIASVHGGINLSWGMVEDHHSPAETSVSPEEYYDLAERFDPEGYNPDRWLAAAREAGMEYAVLTAVHHDGFTLWPSEYSDIGVQTHLEGRDLVGEYVDVCRRQDIRVGLYFSPEQWYHEQYPTEAFGHWETLKSYSYKQLERIDDPGELADFEAYFHDVKRQLEELVSDYGRIDLVWFDHSPWFGTLDDRTGTLVDVIESAQPGAVINARDHFFKGYGHYDADAENYLPDVPIDGWVEPPSPGVTTGGTSRTTSTRTTGGHSTPSSTPRASAVTCFSTWPQARRDDPGCGVRPAGRALGVDGPQRAGGQRRRRRTVAVTVSHRPPARRERGTCTSAPTTTPQSPSRGCRPRTTFVTSGRTTDWRGPTRTTSCASNCPRIDGNQPTKSLRFPGRRHTTTCCNPGGSRAVPPASRTVVPGSRWVAQSGRHSTLWVPCPRVSTRLGPCRGAVSVPLRSGSYSRSNGGSTG